MALLVIGSDRATEFGRIMRELAPTRDVRVWPDAGNAADIRHALAWGPPPGVLKSFPDLELIVSVGAGVDHLMRDPELPDVPVVRYVDPDLTVRMTEYIVLHTVLHMRRMTEFGANQRASLWRYLPEPTAREVRVGMMGLGVLGQAAAAMLRHMSFDVRGWSRTPRTISGMETFAGADGLAPFLASTDILVCLLPLTPDTRGIIDASVLAGLSRDGKRSDRLPGPVLINGGRGGLQVEADILQALGAGTLYAASLDVFETEPLPTASPLWTHPRVVVTPHNAAESTGSSIVTYFLRQVARHEAGQPLENVVDRTRGY